MSRLSHLSERSAVAMCKGQPGPQARCLLSGEDDVSSHLSLYRERPSMTVTGIGKPPVFVFFGGGKRVRFALRK